MVMILNSGYGQIETEQEIISSVISAIIKQLSDEYKTNTDIQMVNPDYKNEALAIVIKETVTSAFHLEADSLAKYQRNGLSILDHFTLNDFFNKNRSSIIVDRITESENKIIYMSKNEWNNILHNGGWDNYHKTFGLIPTIKISRPGINQTKDRALIYYDTIIDKLGGSGFYLITEKVNKHWIVKETMIAWRS